MPRYDKRTNRLTWSTQDLMGGQNTNLSMKRIPDNTLTRAENVHIVGGRVCSGCFAQSASLTTLSKAPYHAFIFEGTPPSLVYCAVEKIYVTTGRGAAVVDRTPSPDFGVQIHPMWSATNIQDGAGHKIVICNGKDKIHYWDGVNANFTIISAAPYMKYVTSFLGRVVGLHVLHGGAWLGNRIEWSAEGDATDWSKFTWGNLDLENERDTCIAASPTKEDLIGAKRIGRLFVFRRHSVYLVEPTGNPEDPLAAKVLFRKGISSPNTMQRLPDDSHIYLGHDDVYLVNTDGGESIGAAIREEMFSTARASYVQYAWSYYDIMNKRYYVVLRNTTGDYQTGWCYNVEEKHWTKHNFHSYRFLIRWYGTVGDY